MGLPPFARRTGLAAVASIAALAFAALASEATAQPPPATPEDFAAAAGGADQYEIMAGHVALIEARDPAVRAFAARMVRDHTSALDALRQAVVRSGLKPPSTSVGGDQAMLLAALQGVGPADFDRAYIHQQVLAHLAAQATERTYARDGSDANLRQAAQSDIPMIERHLQVVERLQSSHGN